MALRLGTTAALGLVLSGCGDEGWYGRDVSGVLPDLDFTLTRARDGRVVTEADFRGQVVAMFFGYTYCPDICQMTLFNFAALADHLGETAEKLSILFVTVDPERDTREHLAGYVASFTDRATGLRGTPDQLAALTRRLRVTYKIEPHAAGATDYAVSHGKSVYIFGPRGDARLLWPEFDAGQANIFAAERDIERLVAET